MPEQRKGNDMKCHGDIVSVNLHTGERQRRVTGNGESWLESLGFPGLKPINPNDLAEYEKTMTEEGIPKIIRAVEMRQRLASKARFRIL